MCQLDKMGEFLDTYSLLKLNQEESQNLNGQITSSEIEAVIKILVTNRRPGPMASILPYIQRRANTYLS